MLTADLLVSLGVPRATATTWAQPLQDSCTRFGINTPRRLAAFLSQVLHESACLTILRELWGPTKIQLEYEPPSRRATGLGNTQPGDGRKFRGYGPIQTSGRRNVRRVTRALRAMGFTDCPDFEQEPEKLMLPRWGSLAAGLFWSDNNINAWADKLDIDAVSGIVNTGRPTGKALHAAERRALHKRALTALGER